MCGTAWVIRCFPLSAPPRFCCRKTHPARRSTRKPNTSCATDTGQDHEPTYAFFVGLGGEARLLGIEGLSDEIVDVQAASGQGGFPDQYSLEFDKQFTPIEVPLNDLVPGLEVTGSLTMTGSVDAWGTVQVPAGSFEALRMHVRGEGAFGLSVAGETTPCARSSTSTPGSRRGWTPSPTSK